MLSPRIKQLLQILKEVRAEYENIHSPDAISKIRRSAELNIAKKLKLDVTSISDKYRRELRPECSNTEEFDLLLTTWITGDSSKLMNILIEHAITEDDITHINYFFQVDDLYFEVSSYESKDIENAVEPTSDPNELDRRVNILTSREN